MTANSEVGTIEPVAEIAAVCRARGVLVHTDAVAAAGTVPLDVKALGVDALSLAGDQFYGPKGSAALFVRKGVRILPLVDGGIQEGGRRGGTENVPAIVGLGAAARLAARDMEARAAALLPLRDRLLEELPRRIEHVVVTGSRTDRLPHHASFCVEFVEGEAHAAVPRHERDRGLERFGLHLQGAQGLARPAGHGARPRHGPGFARLQPRRPEHRTRTSTRCSRSFRRSSTGCGRCRRSTRRS